VTLARISAGYAFFYYQFAILWNFTAYLDAGCSPHFSGRNKGIGVFTTLFSDYYGHQIPVMTRNRWNYLPFSHRVA